MSVRDEVLKALEVKRQSKEIGTSLEAQVIISASSEVHQLLGRNQSQLRALFIVSQVTLKE
jgi:isoleucyl-tRNA synthetase